MARPSELTQDSVDEVADQLKNHGKKPSPNAVRDILGTGSFSTIKQMLDVWLEKQEQDEKIPVPDMPEFAHRLLEKLHRELYLQNYRALEGERQVLEATRHEFEAERKEMLGEIANLETKSLELERSLVDTKGSLEATTSKLAENENRLGKITNEFNDQKIEIATLSERNNQLQIQIKEKDSLLKQAEKREIALQATISGFSKTGREVK
jgi:Mg2+ and Co2+ transporter CorA